MAPNNEAKIAELLRKVVSDPNAAAKLLALAADYLKDREPMPDALADYLADAFRQAARTKPPKNGKRIEDERINQLAHGLYMKRRPEGGRPPKDVPKGDVALTVAVFGNTESQTELSKAVRDATKGTEHEIGLTTARTRIQDAMSELSKGSEKTREIMEANGLPSLIRKR